MTSISEIQYTKMTTVNLHFIPAYYSPAAKDMVQIPGMSVVKLPNVLLTTSHPNLIQLGVELTDALKNYHGQFVNKSTPFPQYNMESTRFLVKWGDKRWQSTHDFKSANELSGETITMVFDGLPPWAASMGRQR